MSSAQTVYDNVQYLEGYG